MALTRSVRSCVTDIYPRGITPRSSPRKGPITRIQEAKARTGPTPLVRTGPRGVRAIHSMIPAK